MSEKTEKRAFAARAELRRLLHRCVAADSAIGTGPAGHAFIDPPELSNHFDEQSQKFQAVIEELKSYLNSSAFNLIFDDTSHGVVRASRSYSRAAAPAEGQKMICYSLRSRMASLKFNVDRLAAAEEKGDNKGAATALEPLRDELMQMLTAVDSGRVGGRQTASRQRRLPDDVHKGMVELASANSISKPTADADGADDAAKDTGDVHQQMVQMASANRR